MPVAVKVLCLVTFLAAPYAEGQGKVVEHGKSRSFVSEKYGFSIAVPPGWFVYAGGDTPVYFNSASRGGFFQGVPPKGGASIRVTAQETESGRSRSARTPQDWAILEAHGASSSSPSIEPFDMPKESEASQAVISAYDQIRFSPDEPSQRCVAVFWVFDQMLFEAQLNYLANDPNGPALTKLFLDTVRSVKPLNKY